MYVMAACFLVIAVPAGAVSITESPDTIPRGGLITITMNDIRDGAQVSLLIDGEFNVVPGEKFSFQTNSFTIPIALNNGQISVTTQGTRSTQFIGKQGGTTVGNAKSADDSGYYSFSEAFPVKAGTYDYLRLEGRARDDVSTISTSMNLVGIKKGPDNSQITFNIDGIDNGLVRVTILVDGQSALPTKTITVGSGLIPQTTTTTPVPTSSTTTTATETTTTETTQTTTTGTQTGTTTTTAAITDATTAATTTGTTTTAPTETTTLQKTFYSPDRKVSLSTRGIDYAGLMMFRGAAIPADWLAIGDAYMIIPESLEFSPRATLAFTLPKNTDANYAYFVGRYENNQWTTVPCSAGTNTIEAEIGRAGTYGLMAFRPESTLPATTVSATGGGAPAQDTTPAAQVTAKGTPRIASFAQAATTAPSQATPAPWLPLNFLLVFAALGICTLVLRRQ
jgi:hypothetical protein